MLLGVGILVGAGALFLLTFTGVLDDGRGYSGPGTATGFGRLDLASLAPAPTPPAPPSDAPLAQLVIPKIAVEAPITVKGVDADGVMETPNGAWDVAWYDFSAKPGFGSNVVFSGHVDYRGVGPAVFWDLKNLTQGDVVEVRLEDGTAYEYRVTAMQSIDAATADVASIVGRTEQELLTLITCIGTFDQATRQYDQRLIVRAERMPDAAAIVETDGYPGEALALQR